MDRAKIVKKLPGLDCGDCGFTCGELAERIADGKASLNDCAVIKAGKNVSVKISGREMYMGGFVQNFIKSTVLGMISSLKESEVREGDTVEIKIKVGKDDKR